MFDRVFSSALAFGVLLAGTIAIASAFLERPAAPVIELPRVEVVGQRLQPAASAVAQAAAQDHASTAVQ